MTVNPINSSVRPTFVPNPAIVLDVDARNPGYSSGELITGPKYRPVVVQIFVLRLPRPFTQEKPNEEVPLDGLSGQCLVAFGGDNDCALRRFPQGVPVLPAGALGELDYGIVW